MRRLIRFLSSVRLAGWLIGALLGLLVLSFLVPQRGIYPPEQVDEFVAMLPSPLGWFLTYAGVDALFSSLIFYVIAVLLALNLTVCTVQRIVRRYRPPGKSAHITVPGTAVVVRGLDVETVEREMAALHGVAEGSDSDGHVSYVVRRGAKGYWGSVALHVALVLFAIGGVVSGLTAFQGEMVLTEGQVVADGPAAYLHVDRVPRLGAPFGDFEIALERMEFSYEDDTIVDAVAHMRVVDAGGSRTTAGRVNYPVSVSGKAFLLYDTGHSVWLTVTTSGGASVFDSFVNIGDAGPMGYADSLIFEGLELHLLSRPDASEPFDLPVQRGLELRTPVVGVASSQDAEVGDYQWLEPGGATVVGEYKIAVNEVRLWNRFMVRADDGRHIVYAGFFLVILGACIRFIDPDRVTRVVLVPSDGGLVVSIWGRQRYWSAHEPREMGRMLDRFSALSGVSIVKRAVDGAPEGAAAGGSADGEPS